MEKHFIDNHHTRLYLNRETERGEDLDYKTDLTVPNQSLSVREIIERFTTGQTIEGGRSTYYDDGDDLEPDPEIIDLADATEIKRDLAEQERVKRARLEDSQGAAADQKDGPEGTKQERSESEGTAKPEGMVSDGGATAPQEA